jgi:hypothetical protein
MNNKPNYMVIEDFNNIPAGKEFYFVINDNVESMEYLTQCRHPTYHILKDMASEEPKRFHHTQLMQCYATNAEAWEALVERLAAQAQWIRENVLGI